MTYRDADYHKSHKLIRSGDGDQEPVESYCDQCWQSFDHYRDGKWNTWVSKPCPASGWRLIIWKLRLAYIQWRYA